MSRSSLMILGSISVLGLVIAGLLVSGILFPTSMQWSVQEDDTLSFTIHVRGFHMDAMNSSTYNDTTPEYWYLNGSSFAVRITDLPSLETSFTAESFASQVLEYTKTSLESPLVLINGTELPDSQYLFLSRLVSHSLLPVGGWDAIDSFYPDSPDSLYYCDTCLSSKTSTSFLIGHRTYNIDAGQGWNATVDLITGLPVQATVWASQFWGPLWFEYAVTVTLTR